MAISMKFEGIDGENTLGERTGFVEVKQFNWGLSRAAGAVRSGARARTEPTVQEVTIRKEMDAASVELVRYALQGQFDRKVEIHFLRTGTGGDPQPYVKYVLQDCGIASYSVESQAGTPLEVYKLNFSGIQFVYVKYDDELKGAPSDVAYFLEDGRVS